MQQTKRLSKRERRILRQQGVLDENNNVSFKLNFRLKDISPLTVNQRKTFKAFEDGKNMLLHGIAGTGKSFISLYLSIKELISGNSRYEKIYIVRSAVPTRDMGFLPGNNKEKSKVYEAPYSSICAELFERGDAYEVLKSKNLIDFISTSYVRGITINDSIIIVDEIANLTLHELDSVITRVGKNCRIIFCGDFRQSDFTKEQEKNGLKEFMRIINKMKSFAFIDFDIEDIVRSDMVKEYIIVKDQLSIIT